MNQNLYVLLWLIYLLNLIYIINLNIQIEEIEKNGIIELNQLKIQIKEVREQYSLYKVTCYTQFD
jgi:hypothetical protein